MFGLPAYFEPRIVGKILGMSSGDVRRLLASAEKAAAAVCANDLACPELKGLAAVRRACAEIIRRPELVGRFGERREVVVLLIRHWRRPISESRVGAILGISQQAVSKARKAVLNKLKKAAARSYRKQGRKLMLDLALQAEAGRFDAILTAEEKKILLDYYVRRQSDAEIGKRLGVSQRAINRRRRRIEEKLRFYLTTSAWKGD